MKEETEKEYKSKGIKLTDKELKEHEKAFTDIDESIKELYKEKKNETKI